METYTINSGWERFDSIPNGFQTNQAHIIYTFNSKDEKGEDETYHKVSMPHQDYAKNSLVHIAIIKSTLLIKNVKVADSVKVSGEITSN